MHEFLLISLIGGLLILLTSAVVYETLAVVWDHLPTMRIGRRRVIVVIAAVFATHIVNIWLYGLTFYLLWHYTDLGSFAGESLQAGYYGRDLWSMVYYSTITYTSLGFGDLAPTGGFRYLSGIEALNGLVLIGWTVSYMFIAMQKYWRFQG